MGCYDKAAMVEMFKHIYEHREYMYQMNHRKVKDRYASSKFYMNNFKHKKGKKK